VSGSIAVNISGKKWPWTAAESSGEWWRAAAASCSEQRRVAMSGAIGSEQ